MLEIYYIKQKEIILRVIRLKIVQAARILRLVFVVSLLLFLCFAGISTRVFAQIAEPGKKVIIVGCEIDYPPFCEVDKAGKATGFSVELIQAAAKAMNYEVVFKTGTWSEVKGLLETGNIDALPLVGRTPEREAIFDFTVPYLAMHGAIVIRSDRKDIGTLQDLIGKEVAVMKNDNAEEFLLRNRFDLKIESYPTFSAALKNLSSGKHDAVLIQRLVALRLLSKDKLANLTVLNQPIEDFRQDWCFAVQESDKETLAMLNEGLAIVVADGTYQSLHAKWFASLQIVAERPIIVGGDNNYPPFEFLDAEGNPTGFNVDIIRAVAKEVGLDIRIHLGEWSQIINRFDMGEIDLIEGMLYSPERGIRFAFSPSHSINHCVSVVREDSGTPPENLAQLKNKKIVVQNFDIMHDFVKANGLEPFTTVFDTQERALRELVAGNYDVALVARLPASYLIEKNNWNNLEVAQQPLVSSEYCFAVSHRQKALLAKLGEGLKLIVDSGEYRRIQSKWMGIETDPFQRYAKVLHYVSMFTGPLLLSILAMFAWSWSLKKQVGKQTEDLKKSAEQFRSLIEGAPYAIFVQSEGKFVYLNRAAAKLFASNSEENPVGQPVFDRFASSSKVEAGQKNLGLIVEKKNAPPMPATITRIDGVEVPVEISSVPTLFAEREGTLVFIRDISRQLQLENQLLQSSKMEAVGHLAGGVAHDYNNMLSVILGYTELAMNSLEAENPVLDDLREVYSAAQRSAEITSQLLAFARKQAIVRKSLNVNRTVESMSKMLRRLIGEDIELVLQLEKDLWQVNMDSAQIDQILANLCVNARDAISGIGRIVIQTRNVVVAGEESLNAGLGPGEYVMLSVNDDGCGMSEETRSKIFDPFYTTKDVGKGTGLGLATVYGILKQNNGEIKVISELEKGTTFQIFFSRFDQEEEGQLEISEELLEGNGEIILLVEDELAILKLTIKVLEGLNYRAIAANSPNEALQIANDLNKKIDLLITDVIMPEMNGSELIEKLRETRPELRCMFMSGYTSDIIGQHGVLEADVDFIEKPYTVKSVAKKLREIFTRKINV